MLARRLWTNRRGARLSSGFCYGLATLFDGIATMKLEYINIECNLIAMVMTTKDEGVHGIVPIKTKLEDEFVIL